MTNRTFALFLTALASCCLALSQTSVSIVAQFELPSRQPQAAPLAHADGSFYGTTIGGGAHDAGSVYRLDPQGNVTILHSFNGSDGQAPASALVPGRDGLLFGTTEQGGANGFGTVFRISTSGAFATVVHFSGAAGPALGSVPGALQPGPSNTLYGVTQAGGTSNHGTLFRLNSDDSLATLLQFSGNQGAAPGAEPVGPLAVSGNTLIGVTRSGGANGLGQIFSIVINGAYTSRGSFTGAAGVQPGANPSTGLLAHSNGFLYGATEFGGANASGLLFRLDADARNFSPLHHFDDPSGSRPAGPLAQASDGAILGTASSGGLNDVGSLFRLLPGSSFTSLASFNNINGASPRSGLAAASNGKLYGAASAGGPGQRGTLFSYASAGGFAVEASFTNSLGWSPAGAPYADDAGNLLLPLAQGGSNGAGAIASILPNTSLETRSALDPKLAANPSGPLFHARNQTLGVAQLGGVFERGSVFRVAANGSIATVANLSSTAGEGVSGPLASLPDGTLYGLSQAGGLANHGAIFKIDPAGALSRVLSFTGVSGSRKGRLPSSPLALANDGFIYGVTQRGGAADQGTLFSLDPSASLATIIEFSANSAHQPSGGLALAPNGKLYGPLLLGGQFGQGALLEFDPASATWLVAASFSGNDGPAPLSNPIGSLALGLDGALYGIANAGGLGFGGAFRFSPQKGLEILAQFTGKTGAAPGIPSLAQSGGQPIIGGAARAPDGFVYAALPAGGEKGGGTLLRIDASSPLETWKKSELGNFAAQDDLDPDHDGLANLLEYAIGSSPSKPNLNDRPAHRIDFASGPERLALAFNRVPGRLGVTLLVEAASSPAGPWTPIATSVDGQAFTGTALAFEALVSNNLAQISIADSIAPLPGSPRFLRLRAQR